MRIHEQYYAHKDETQVSSPRMIAQDRNHIPVEQLGKGIYSNGPLAAFYAELNEYGNGSIRKWFCEGVCVFVGAAALYCAMVFVLAVWG